MHKGGCDPKGAGESKGTKEAAPVLSLDLFATFVRTAFLLPLYPVEIHVGAFWQ